MGDASAATPAATTPAATTPAATGSRPAGAGPSGTGAGGLAGDIGRRLAAHRGRRGMRVAELARVVGVTPSLISQIERGQSRPSVSTLFAMAQALDIPVDAFFRENAADERAPAGAGPERPPADPGRVGVGQRYVVRRGHRAAIDIQGGVRWERLTPEALRHLDFFELVYGPGAESNPTLYSHPGTEMVLVMSGRLDISVGFETYRLEPGDSMQFPSSMPHRYANPEPGTTRAVTVILYDCLADAVDVPPHPAPAT